MQKAYTHFFLGQYALGLPWVESAAKLEPNNRIISEVQAFAWNSTHQFERTIESSPLHPASIAHWQLGHLEEALLLAREPAVEGLYIQPYFQILNASGNSQNLIQFLENRWPDLADFEADFTFHSDIRGYAPLNEIALAYIRFGEHEKAQVALARIREGQKRLEAQGRNNYRFSLNKAVYFTLTGDHDTALEHLAASIDGGYIGSVRLTTLVPALEELEGDPRYEAIQARMIRHLNNERAALGLDPVAK